MPQAENSDLKQGFWILTKKYGAILLAQIRNKSSQSGSGCPAESDDLLFLRCRGWPTDDLFFYLRSRGWPSDDLLFLRLAGPAKVTTYFFFEDGRAGAQSQPRSRKPQEWTRMTGFHCFIRVCLHSRSAKPPDDDLLFRG